MWAYDTVDRGILWTKMKGLGFDGKFLANIQDFYMGDNIVSEVAGVSTRPVYLGRGVRQGCSMSPLLFALYLSTMGHELSLSIHGVKLHKVRVSAMFFADDIVLVAETEEGLKELLRVVNLHCGLLKMNLSATKSKVLSSSSATWELFEDDEVVGCLDKVLSYSYLGVEVQLSPYKGSAAIQKRALRVANRYRAACISIARDGPDVVDFAMALWKNIALPSAMYGSESVHFSSSNIDILERQQIAVGKFALGLPVSAPNAYVSAMLGLRPIRQILYSGQLKFLLRLRQQDSSRWSHDAYLDHIHGDWASPFLSNIDGIKREVGMSVGPVSSKHVDEALSSHFLHKLNSSILNLDVRGIKHVDKLAAFRHVRECRASQVGGEFFKVFSCYGFVCLSGF